VLVLSGVKLANAPGADYIVVTGFILGAIVFATWGVIELRSNRARLVTDPPLS
jgi:hypothetical protein